jgi:hypothetical protein
MNKFVANLCIGFIVICMTILVNSGTVYANFEAFAEPNPPEDRRDAEMLTPSPTVSRSAGPSVEWEYHKTPDNRHPNGNEQQLMWLMNRARSNPAGEGMWFAAIHDRYYPFIDGCSGRADDTDFCHIAGALDFWDVDLDLLQDEFAGYEAKPPAAFDVRLYKAAKAHSDYLISIDGQNHTGQFDRIDDQNFSYRRARGNVFSYSLSANYGHAAFNVDWGTAGGDGSGMQSPRGHRLAIMSIDGDYTNVGYAVVPASDLEMEVGPLVITGNYCEANAAAQNHYNRFIVGTVWSDDDGDDFYDPGEGIGGVTVMPDQGGFYAVTSDAGGYAVPITQAGTYEVTFSGGGRALSEDIVKTVGIVDESVLLDLVVDENSEPSGDDASRDSRGGGGGCFVRSVSQIADHQQNAAPVPSSGLSDFPTLLLAADLCRSENAATPIVICLLFAIILLGSIALGGRRQKE